MSRSNGKTWAAFLVAAFLVGSSAWARRAGVRAVLRRPGEALAAAFNAGVSRAYGATPARPAASEDVRAASTDRRRER